MTINVCHKLKIVKRFKLKPRALEDPFLQKQNKINSRFLNFQEKKIRKVFCPFLKDPFTFSLKKMPPYNNKRPDIVIIELKSPFDLINGIKPACLPKEDIVTGSMCYASGWGMTKSWKFGEDPPSESSKA